MVVRTKGGPPSDIRRINGAPSDDAEGISTALFTTLCGLFIAIPAIAAHNIIRNRVARLVLEVGMLSDELRAIVDRNTQYQDARRRALAMLDKGLHLGGTPASRDKLHER